MTTELPATAPVPSDDGQAADAEWGVLCADAVLAGRAMSSGQYLAGLLAAAEVDTAGTPTKLPADQWPGVDPVVVQEIWDRACVVAWRASQFAGAPWLNRDRLQDLQGRLSEAGFHAMAGLVGRSRGLVVRPGLAADSEIGREH